MISGGFFHDGSPELILRKDDGSFAIAKLAPPGERQVKSLDPSP